MMQDAPTDQDLMAYADGEMEPVAAEALRVQIQRDPALAARLHMFVATRDAVAGLRAQDAVATDLSPALAARLHTTIAAAPRLAERPSRDGSGGANVLPLRRKAAGRVMPIWTGALAASLALAGGLAGGLLASRPDTARDPVFAALDTVPSGESASLSDGRQVWPIASFEDADGSFCREYEVRSPAGPAAATVGQTAAVAIACAQDDGWETRLLVATAAADGYAPAAAPAVLDSYYDQTGATQPLSAEAEAAVLLSRQTEVGTGG